MTSIPRGNLPRDVARVRERVNHWRRTRPRRSAMPEELWSAAVTCARTHGVNPVARAVRLDYYCLKRRLDAEHDQLVPAQAFVEVALDPVAPRGDSARGHVVEMERPDGGRMRLVVDDGDVVVRLSEAFWRGCGE